MSHYIVKLAVYMISKVIYETEVWVEFMCLIISATFKLLTVFFFFFAEVQHIVTETRDKIMQYKSKMVDEADLRRRLASLEESVELHEHMKRQVIHCCWAPRGLHSV